MVEKIINFSSEVSDCLSQYPKWLEMVDEAKEKPAFDKNYCPHVIEIFDQHGLLAGKINGLSAYECTREIQQKSEFNAWLFLNCKSFTGKRQSAVDGEKIALRLH